MSSYKGEFVIARITEEDKDLNRIWRDVKLNKIKEFEEFTTKQRLNISLDGEIKDAIFLSKENTKLEDVYISKDLKDNEFGIKNSILIVEGFTYYYSISKIGEDDVDSKYIGGILDEHFDSELWLNVMNSYIDTMKTDYPEEADNVIGYISNITKGVYGESIATQII